MMKQPEQDPIQDLISNKELALEIYRQIPQQAMYMRVNRGCGMFYLYHGDEKQGGKIHNQPQRYLRYCQTWEPMTAIQGTWAEFCAENGVFAVSDFKLDLAQAYPVEVLGNTEGWEILRDKPIDATHYNLLSRRYHRMGPGECTEVHNTYGEVSHWHESAHLNENISEQFIDLEKLLLELQRLDNYTAY